VEFLSSWGIVDGRYNIVQVTLAMMVVKSRFFLINMMRWRSHLVWLQNDYLLGLPDSSKISLETRHPKTNLDRLYNCGQAGQDKLRVGIFQGHVPAQESMMSAPDVIQGPYVWTTIHQRPAQLRWNLYFYSVLPKRLWINRNWSHTPLLVNICSIHCAMREWLFGLSIQ